MKWQHAGEEIDIPRNAVIIDSNVLFAFFYPNDEKHEDAQVFFEEYVDIAVIPVAVLVETWGLLVGSRKRTDLGQQLLLWATTSVKVILLGGESLEIQDCRATLEKFEVDLVDALISCLADKISKALDLNPPIDIASFDTRDLIKYRLAGYKFRLWNIEADEKY